MEQNIRPITHSTYETLTHTHTQTLHVVSAINTNTENYYLRVSLNALQHLLGNFSSGILSVIINLEKLDKGK